MTCINQLKNKRLLMGLTQVQVADKAGIAERSYQYIEAGERSPNVQTAKRLAKVLNSTVEELFP